MNTTKQIPLDLYIDFRKHTKIPCDLKSDELAYLMHTYLSHQEFSSILDKVLWCATKDDYFPEDRYIKNF